MNVHTTYIDIKNPIIIIIIIIDTLQSGGGGGGGGEVGGCEFQFDN